MGDQRSPEYIIGGIIVIFYTNGFSFCVYAQVNVLLIAKQLITTKIEIAEHTIFIIIYFFRLLDWSYGIAKLQNVKTQDKTAQIGPTNNVNA